MCGLRVTEEERYSRWNERERVNVSMCVTLSVVSEDMSRVQRSREYNGVKHDPGQQRSLCRLSVDLKV